MGKAILVVEDDPDMREWISLHLRNGGYTVSSVANGLQVAGACLGLKRLPPAAFEMQEVRATGESPADRLALP